MRFFFWVGLAVLLGCSGSAASAQQKAAPGQFDFYVLNLSWSPEFCAIEATSAECAAHPGFVVHGLWPQNFNGTYPVDCSKAKGPKNFKQYLDVTPDLTLLEHEWTKHGTCSGLAPNVFFTLERTDLHAVTVPPVFVGMTGPVNLAPSAVEEAFRQANPQLPVGSVKVSCSQGELTAVEVCLAKNGLTATACQGIQDCADATVTILPQGTVSHLNRKQKNSR